MQNLLNGTLPNIRYVQKVPLAAELLDVRRSQKLRMVKDPGAETGGAGRGLAPPMVPKFPLKI